MVDVSARGPYCEVTSSGYMKSGMDDKLDQHAPPPPPSGHREFGFKADLDLALKVGKSTYPLPPPLHLPGSTGHRDFGIVSDLDLASKVQKLTKPLPPSTPTHHQRLGS